MIYTKNNIVGLKFVCSWAKHITYKIGEYDNLKESYPMIRLNGNIHYNTLDVCLRHLNEKNLWLVINLKLSWYYKLKNIFI